MLVKNSLIIFPQLTINTIIKTLLTTLNHKIEINV